MNTKVISLFFSVLLVTVAASAAERKWDCKVGNPFSPGTGHFAGYEWAKKKRVRTCGGNSDSFIEGCAEYLKQIECLIKSREPAK